MLYIICVNFSTFIFLLTFHLQNDLRIWGQKPILYFIVYCKQRSDIFVTNFLQIESQCLATYTRVFNSNGNIVFNDD